MENINKLWIYPIVFICFILVLWLLISFIYSYYMHLYAKSIIRKYDLHKEIYPGGIPMLIKRLFIKDICLYNKKINQSGILWIIPRIRIDKLLDR